MEPSKPIRTFIFVSVPLFRWHVLQIKVSDFSYQPQKLKLFPQSPQNTKRTEFKDILDRSIKFRVGNRNTGSDRKMGLITKQSQEDMKGFYLNKLIAIYVRVYRFFAILIWHAFHR